MRLSRLISSGASKGVLPLKLHIVDTVFAKMLTDIVYTRFIDFSLAA